MKIEVPVNIHTLDFPEDTNIPEEAKHSILVPCWGQDFIHYYYLIDYNAHRTIFFEVHLEQYVEAFKEKMKQNHDDETSPHHMSFDQLVFWTTCPHQGEYFDGSLIISLTYANFFVSVDLINFKAYLIYDENTGIDQVYSSTNQIVDGIMYTSRWKFSDMYKKDPMNKKPVQLEVVTYDIKNDKFSVIDTIPGSDQIHTTALSPDKRYVIMIEMNVDPVVPSMNIQKEPDERKIEILQKGLVDSSCYVYDLKEKKYSSIVIPSCPAHLVFDDENPDIVYLSQHKMAVIRADAFSFGPCAIMKYRLTGNGTLELIEKFYSEDAIRVPGHTMFNYKGKKLIATPITPFQVFLIDCHDMSLHKKIELRKGIKPFDFSNGPVVYSFMSLDRTPYTAQPINEAQYLYLSNILSIGIYDFVADKYVCNFRYNPGMPIIGGGHSTLFEDVKLGTLNESTMVMNHSC